MKELIKFATSRLNKDLYPVVAESGAAWCRASFTDIVLHYLPDGAMPISPGVYDPKFLKVGEQVASTYPELERITSGGQGIPTETITLNRDRLDFYANAMSDDQTRYYLNGVCFSENKICATDGNRLHFTENENPMTWTNSFKSEMSFGVIVPGHMIREALKLFPKCKEFLLSFYDNKTVRLEPCGTNYYFMANLIDGNYPPIDRVIPETNDKELASFDYRDFVDMLKAVKPLPWGKKPKIAKISDSATIEFKDGDTVVEKEFALEPGKRLNILIGLNLEFLAETAITGEIFYSPSGPVMIRDAEKSAVVMPFLRF